jgi:hypothetical protein
LDHKFAKSDLFEDLLTENEKCAWLMFKVVCLNFFGNVKTENYKQLVEDLLNAYQTLGCDMSLKIHFSHSQTPSEPGHSEQQTWGLFHHDISTVEKRCTGKLS